MEAYSNLTKKRVLLKDVLPLKKPFALFIEPTNICNFRCVQCPHGRDDYHKINKAVTMNRDLMDKLISNLSSWDNSEPFRVIRLYLEGEPLLCDDFAYLLENVREKVAVDRIELTTNASLLTEEIAEILIRHQVDYVRVSVYSVREQRHREITKSSVFTPEMIRENVRVLKKLRVGVKPFIYVKMLESLDGENEEFIEYYKEIADEIAIEPCMNWSNTEDADFIKKLYGDDGEQIIKERIKERGIEKYACPYPFHTMSVKSNGDVLVCCVDWLCDTKIGNIKESTLQEIWGG